MKKILRIIAMLCILLILIGIVAHQRKEIHKLECKTLNAFRIVRQKINVQNES